MAVENAVTDHTVELTLASTGAMIDVWDEYIITQSMLSAGSPWTFTLWRSATRTATWEVLRRAVKCMDSVVVKIDGAVQLNGRIESIETSADGHGEARMTIAGRDLAGPALDWDADPTANIAGLTLEAALQRVFASVGLPVKITTADAAREVSTKRRGGAGVTATEAAASSAPRGSLPASVILALRQAAALPSLYEAGRAPVVGVDATADITALQPRRAAARARAKRIKDIIIPAAHPRPGERVWGFAESIVSRIGALMWTAPDPTRGMTIVVDTPANDDPPTYAFARVERDGVTDPRSNILSLTEKIDTRPAPTFVKVYTGSERGDKVSARQVATTTNTALTTARITRGFVVASPPPQPRHMRSTRAKTLARAAKEGERVVLDAMRDFRTVRLTVRGHGQVVNGVPTLYGINSVARVYDSVCTDARGNALDEAMLITQVTFRRSRAAGTITELMLVPLGALKMEPEGV